MEKELLYQVPLQHKILWLISVRLYSMNNVHVFILHVRRCHCPKVSNFDTAASGNTFDLNVGLCRFEHDSRYMCVLSGHCFWKDFCLWHSYTWQVIQVCAVISVHLLSYFVWNPINQMYSQLLCKSKISLGGIWLSFAVFCDDNKNV